MRLRSLAGVLAVLSISFLGQAATLTYDFDGGTLQGWHNRVWDLNANWGTGGWVDLSPNATALPTSVNGGVVQPPSSNNNLFGNSGMQVYPIGGSTDNHQNTLWLRSPEFALDGSGNLTVQLGRGKADGAAPPDEFSIAYAAVASSWKGVALRRVSDGVFLLAKARTSNSATFVTVTFSADELAPFVGTTCTLDLINPDNGSWGWITMDNVSIPGYLMQSTLTLPAPSIVVGSDVAATLAIPSALNASAEVTVVVTNSNPGAVAINGIAAAEVPVTFAAGAPASKTVTLSGVGLGFARLTVGGGGAAPSLNVDLMVLPPSGLIGRWLSGAEDLLDKSGFSPAGTHDGMMPQGLTAVFSSAELPPGVATGFSLDVTNSGSGVLIANTGITDAGYRPTFDEGISQQFSVVFWAKGLPGSWNPFVSKYGEGSSGWQVRRRTTHPAATFTIRGTGADDNPYSGAVRIDDGAWHHYAATWDGIAGVRRLYVDGKLNIDLANDAGPMGLADANYLTLGGRAGIGSSIPGNTLDGFLYDVQIYGIALEGSAVQSLYRMNTSAIVAHADTQVIDQGKTGVVSVTIPAAANATAAVTVHVTNTTPAVVSVAGAVGGVAILTFPAGGPATQTLTLTGFSDGQAQLVFAADGLTGSSVTVPVYGPQLIGHWLTGVESFANSADFAPAGAHDGVEVGTAGSITFSSDTPPSKPGKAAQFAGTSGLQIGNSGLLDAGYAPTFDNVIAHQFSVAFWAKGLPGNWNPFVSKRGDTDKGWQVRRQSSYPNACFTIRGSPAADDPQGAIRIDDGIWHHFTAVWDGYAGARKLYVDGVLDPNVNLTGDFAPMTLAPYHALMLGARKVDDIFAAAPGIDGQFTGLLYDVRIYNYPLSVDEAKDLAFVAALQLTPAQRSVQAPLTMAVDVVLPAGALEGRQVVVEVTNHTPALILLVGGVDNKVTLTYPVGGSLTQQVTVVGIADGKAMLSAAGGGFTAGTTAFNVWSDPGSRLIGRWISGETNLADTSGFRPAGKHDGVAIGANAALLAFSTDVPAIAPEGAQSLDLRAGSAGVMIANTAVTDPDYVETFDNQVANKLSIAFWAKGPAPATEDWNAWVSKRGENDMGYQVRRSGTTDPVRPVFTLRGTPASDDPGANMTVDGESWHHYAATWDGATGIRTLYVDGVSGISLGDDYGPFALATSDHLVLGGLDTGGFRRFFPCLLYDVRIYSYALSETEVAELVNPPTPPQVFAIILAHQNLPLGATAQIVITLPPDATATAPLTVYLTNGSPGVVALDTTAVIFPMGSAVQTVSLQTVGLGQIHITAGAAEVGSAELTTTNSVVAPKLIGQWFSGAADLADKSGHTPAGTHDAVVVGANPAALTYSADVPLGFSGQSLDLTANTNTAITVGVIVNNSGIWDAGYLPTFDDPIASAFSVAFWAKGIPAIWNPFVTKGGEGIPGVGWQVRRGGGNTEAFTIRGTASGNPDGVGSVVITDSEWHHFAAVWDGIAGTRTCYVDGALDPSLIQMGDFGPMSLAPDHHVGIGVREQDWVGSYEGWFGGKLYDVRIYNYAISSAEVASLIAFAPELTIQRWTGTQVRISWPASYAGFSLEQSSAVASGWVAAGLTATIEGSEQVVYAPTASSPRFFRLKK
ncbi:MAG TPA: LamG domain-containing protein [Candidatus Paceibacterota bacterium]|nr:LamG domain-containing protein [Verrucomicrobiota bacterium]HOX04654.1 LamG domain-containing protein [Verrucomicrobiota bacterium]HRZ47621.1 LamG domain-containing protein [Candidatus Paceibacterota bacterium]